MQQATNNVICRNVVLMCIRRQPQHSRHSYQAPTRLVHKTSLRTLTSSNVDNLLSESQKKKKEIPFWNPNFAAKCFLRMFLLKQLWI